MLSKKYRLKKDEITQVAKTGSSKQSTNIILKFLASEDDYKFAVSVSKKRVKTAVERNKTKRKIKASLYALLKLKKIKPGKYLLVVKNNNIKGISDENINYELETLFKK